MSAGGGSEKCSEVVQRNGPNLSTSAALRALLTPLCAVAHLLSFYPLACLQDQWGFSCSYALARRASRARFQGGSIPPSVYEPSVGGMITIQGVGKVQKWETNGLINAVLAINAVLGAVN